MKFEKNKRRYRIASCILFGMLLLGLPYILGSRYWIYIATVVGINAVMALSLRLVMVTGLLNLALPVFMAVGAYTAAVLLIRTEISFIMALMGGGVLAAVFGIILGYPFLRVKGVYFFLITLSLLELFRMTISEHWREVLGGADGIYGIPFATIGSAQLTGRIPYYYICLSILLAAFVLCWRIEKSWFGKVLHSMRDADSLCRAVGIDTLKMRMVAFTIQCFLAGVLGAFYAMFLRGVNPNMFGFEMAIAMQVYLIVGGVNSLWGPLLGALLFGGLSDIFRGLGPYQMLIYGITLIIVMKFLPGGLISLPQRIKEAWKSTKSRREEEYVTT